MLEGLQLLTIVKSTGIVALFLIMLLVADPAVVKTANAAPRPQALQACEVMGAFAEEFARGRDTGVAAENFRRLALEDFDETMYRNVGNVLDLVYRNPNIGPARAKAWVTELCMAGRR